MRLVEVTNLRRCCEPTPVEGDSFRNVNARRLGRGSQAQNDLRSGSETASERQCDYELQDASPSDAPEGDQLRTTIP